MRNVSHLPPATAISALAYAAPLLVAFAPSTKIVAPLRAPLSSEVISFIASCPAGICEPNSTDERAWRVTPLARSITAGGRSSYFRPAAHRANWRLSDGVDCGAVREREFVCAKDATAEAARAAPECRRKVRRKRGRSHLRCMMTPRMLSGQSVERD